MLKKVLTTTLGLFFVFNIFSLAATEIKQESVNEINTQIDDSELKTILTECPCKRRAVPVVETNDNDLILENTLAECTDCQPLKKRRKHHFVVDSTPNKNLETDAQELNVLACRICGCDAPDADEEEDVIKKSTDAVPS